MSAEFSLHVADCGYRVIGTVVSDAHFHRTNWKPESGKGDATWYIGFKHDDFEIITWGDFRDDFREVWTSRGNSRLSASEKAMLKSDLEKARAEAAAKKAEMANSAIAGTFQIWCNADIEPEFHPYLTKKGITGKYLRSWKIRGQSELLAGLRDDNGDLRNLQRIGADGVKRFIKNAPVSGLSWMSGKMPPADFHGDIAVVEGVATAETVREISGLTVFAAITAGNLPAITKWIRSKWPASRILIGADDDRWEKDGTPRPLEKNAGRKKSAEAAEGTRALIILPAWNNLQSRGTDWNDLAGEEGTEGARAKWINAVTVATLDRQVAGMGVTEYNARKESLRAAYKNAGLGAIGSRQLDQRREENRGGSSGNDVQGERAPHVVMAAICEDVDLWRDQFGIAYATFPHNNVVLNAQIQGNFFKDWLRVQWDEEESSITPPSESVLTSVINQNAARARLNAPYMISYYRMGYDAASNTHWWDLGRPDWKMIRFSADGWEITKECPIKFAHSESKCDLPLPEKNPEMNGMAPLWEILNIAEEDRCLIAGFLLGAMLSTAPCFGLNLYGAHGTSKSITSGNIRRILDQSPAPFQTLNERNVDELGLTCIQQWIPCFENMSRLAPEIQDVLCSLTTKLSAKTRELYTNTGIVSYEVRRPWIINGINNVCSRGDLAQRAIPVALLPAPEGDDRKKEAWIEEKFLACRPHIMAVLLDAAVEAMFNGPAAEKFLSQNGMSHRMADALEWITSGESLLGFPAGSFIRRLNQLQEAAGWDALDGNPVVRAIETLLNDSSRGYWKGSHDEILTTMHEADPTTKRDKYLPHDNVTLANWMGRETERLRKSYGIVITLSTTRPRDRTGGRRRLMEIHRITLEPDDTNPN